MAEVPYDPLGFINSIRVKYRWTPYVHCKMPHIEEYANQDGWAKGSIVEEFTEEEIMEQNVKDLEKTLDLDSCQQVTFKLPQQIGEGTSAATTTQPSQAPSSSTTGTTRGKEPLDIEQVARELPATSMEQSQEKAPSQ